MRTWLITGCSSGIGRGIAKAVLEAGYNAVVTARNIDTIKEFASDYSETALTISLDVTNKESIKKAVEQAYQRFGSIDILVNNAGYGYRSAIEEGDINEVETLFKTNLFGPIELIKEVLPQMRKKRSGAIVNVSSIAAEKAAPGSGYYAASKAAIALISDALASELKPLGIKVMIVEPGAFKTNFFDTSLKDSKIRIEDYDQTAGKRRKENMTEIPETRGEPDKAGKIIVETITKEEYPRRLLLGSDAIHMVSSALSKRIKELEEWSEISIKTDC